jgi:serine phosphatase RsbU (regulator of sigma subunit)
MKGEEEFGEERLQRILNDNQEKTAQQILSALFEAVKKFSTNNHDDQTALLIKVE